MSTPAPKPVGNDPSAKPTTSSGLVIPTGEAQVGTVKSAPPAQEIQPEPVLEHRVAPPAPAPSHATAPVHSAPPPAAPEAPSIAERTATLAATSPAPLQESPQVSIPARMNQLHSENQRLRDELQNLEKALKKTLS